MLKISQSCHSITSLVTVLFFGLLLVACGQDANEEASESVVVRPVKTITVSAGGQQVKKTYPAVVLPSQEVALSFRVSGKILELPIRNGLKVKKDDVIAQLDQRDFKAQITQLRSQLDQATAKMKVLQTGARPEDLAALQAAVSAAEAELNAAQAQYSRIKELVDKQLVARAELDNASSTLAVTKANVNVKRQELQKGKAGGRDEDIAGQKATLEGLESQLQSLEDALGDSTLRAPFDGIIASRKVETFANIQAKETVAVLQKISDEIDLVFDIPGSDVVILSPIKDQLKVKVMLDSFQGREFDAEQREFSTEADKASQTYQGRVAIKTASGEPILPGMTGSVIVTGQQVDNAQISLPAKAIASKADGKPFIWVVEQSSNKVSQRDVKLGEASGDQITVANGLNEGEVVVVAGLSSLQEGLMVKPIANIGE